jgi:hypothetical protein
MRDHDVTVALRHALSSLPRVVDSARKDNLRTYVHAFVDISKEREWPVERTIVALKEIAAEAGLRSSTDILRVNAPLELRDALLLDIVRWCVERYYGYSRPTPRQQAV